MKKEMISGKVIIKLSIIWVIVLTIIGGMFFSFFKNYIFAIDITQEDEIQKIEPIIVEPNETEIDILSLMIQNNYRNKKLLKEERRIPYETKKEDDSQIPNGEEVLITKGKDGTKQVTSMQELKNSEFISEEILEERIIKEPITEVIHVGTSDFLKKLHIHIGEKAYLTEQADLKEEPNEDSKTITTIKRYLNFEVLEVLENWTRVKYKDKEGYLQNDLLTSEEIMPIIKEKNRIAELQASLCEELDLSNPSGLTLSDFKTVLENEPKDKNNIFGENAEVFYNMEQKYNINGMFLVAIGIHESAWGTSYLAKEKHNLFGYRAYDRDPINSAQDFIDYEECIDTVASAVSKNYLSPTGAYFYGTTVEAVNTKYATDTEWHNKVYSYMEYLYNKLK